MFSKRLYFVLFMVQYYNTDVKMQPKFTVAM